MSTLTPTPEVPSFLGGDAAQPSKEQQREAAQKAVEAAEDNLTLEKAKIAGAQKAKAEAQAILDAAKPNIMLAEAAVTVAKAHLLAFGPLPKASGPAIEGIFDKVLAVLKESPKQMTVNDIRVALEATGVHTSNDNLKAYCSRWSQAGAIMKGEKANRLEPARYYAPPTNGTQAPAFLGGAPATTPIPSEFPASLVLAEVGITTMEAIPRDEESLRKIKGVGSATAKAILTALGE